MKPLPYIVDIKRHSLEDGPGIRTVVFFKGCPLKCLFCQNPESQNENVEIAFTASACIGCGACASQCPAGAIAMDLPGRIRRDRCMRCGTCAAACPGSGMRLIGTGYSVDALMEIVLRDEAYYRHSGGGVTLSGGECTMHPAFLELFLGRLKEKEIHVVLETSGYFDYEAFSKSILPYVDSIYYDIKIIDPQRHIACTSRPNRLILENFRRLAKEHPQKVFPRIPLVPGITATKENLRSIVDFLRECGAREGVLLPYNPAGRMMHEKLGTLKPATPESFMMMEDESLMEKFVREYAAGCVR